jgi:lipoyl(octanoyl) transferase
MVDCRIRRLAMQEYDQCWQAMRRFTDQRDANTADEIWLLEHFPVYTQGTSCKRLPRTTLEGRPAIPVVSSDRGGQITYHGPGQIIFYLLLNIKRLSLGPKAMVHHVESAVIDSLAFYNIEGERRPGAPGVYVDGKKIAALGLRIRKNCTYHGLSFNADVDLSPYEAIDPCGYAGLEMTRLCDIAPRVSKAQIEQSLLDNLQQQLDLAAM